LGSREAIVDTISIVSKILYGVGIVEVFLLIVEPQCEDVRPRLVLG
jgi:hypothetical protein